MHIVHGVSPILGQDYLHYCLRNRNYSLKYIRSATSGCKDKDSIPLYAVIFKNFQMVLSMFLPILFFLAAVHLFYCVTEKC